MVHPLRLTFLMTYAVSKALVTSLEIKMRSKYSSKSFKIFSLVLTVLIIILVSIGQTPFLIFRACMYLALKLKYGRNFGGFLTGLDTIFELSDESTVINVAVVYRFNQEERTKLKKLITNYLINACEQIEKSRSSLNCFCGYYYYVKDMVKVEDLIEFVEDDNVDCLTRNYILDYIQENCSTIRENRMWKATTFLRPVNWKGPAQNEYGKQYITIFTIKHSGGDGPSLMTALKTLLMETNGKASNEKINRRLNPNQRPEVTLDNAHLYRNIFIEETEGDILKIEGNSKWQLAVYNETERKYVPIIKNVKNKLGASFGDVINAAVSSSILDYMEKRGINTDTVSASSIVRANSDDLLEIINGTYKFKNIANHLTMVTYKLPFEMSETSMENKILSMSRVSKDLANSLDAILLYSLLQYVCTYLPKTIFKLLLTSTMHPTTLTTTNLVGFDECSCFGYPLDDMFFCVPNGPLTGFLFSIFSYDGRLTMTVCSRNGHVHNREELQMILDDTLRYIDQANEEIL